LEDIDHPPFVDVTVSPVDYLDNLIFRHRYN